MSSEIKWGPIGKDVYERTYSRCKPDGSDEIWPETITRTVDGNLALVDKKHWRRNERNDLIELFTNFGALPAGRHLWVSGIKGRQFIFNCHNSHWRDRFSDHYAFTFDELMKGGGVGTNYSNRFIKQYGPVKNKINVHFVCDPKHDDYGRIYDFLSNDFHYTWNGCIPIEDSREGWVGALVKLLDTSMDKTIQEHTIVFDVTRIRPYGSPIRSFGGVASGPEALVKMLISICDLLNTKVGEKLTSLDHMEIDHRIATCVVAGNVRRSARMSIKSWKDSDIFDFINCKSDNVRTKHWTTNISVEIDNSFLKLFKKKDEHALKVYRECISSMYESGEPGFCNISLAQHGEFDEIASPNPCVTGDTWIFTDDGPKQVFDLVGKKFNAIVNGMIFPSTNSGFFETGEKKVFKVKTDNGYSFICTDNHLVPIVENMNRDDFDIVWKKLSEVNIMDNVALSNHRNTKWSGEGSEKLGWLIGSWIGDGTTSLNSAKLEYWGDSAQDMHKYACNLIRKTVGSNKNLGRNISIKDKMSVVSIKLMNEIKKLGMENKDITEHTERCSSDFYIGFIRGWFDADGSVQGTQKKGVSIRMASSKLDNLYCLQRMLSRLGIISKVYSNRRGDGQRLLPDGSGGKKYYTCKANHELIISKSNVVEFANLIGFKEPKKCNKLNNLISSYIRTPNRESFVDTIISIEELGKTKVFDCQVPNINEFCGNGVRLHNCGEIFLMPFESCNLGHVNLSKFYDNPDGAKKAFMLMTRFLIRATFADISSPWQQEIVKRNRRIGVGFFGFQDWLCKQGKKYSECHNDLEVQSLLRQFYRVVKKTAMEYSHELRIPAPIKNTALAPTGTIAKLCGSTEGAQAMLFPYYIQRVRYQKDDPKVNELIKNGTELETCINKEEAVNTIIAKYYCKHPLIDEVESMGFDSDDLIEGQHDISIEDTLAIQSMLQREWADNSISLTINLSSDITKEELYNTMIKFLPKVKGTTVLVGDGGRPQPPYTSITKEEYDMYTGTKIVSDLESECARGSCPIK